MTGRHYQWHKKWTREPDGVLLHESGLRVRIDYANPGGIVLAESLKNFREFKMRAGVPEHMLGAVLKRLMAEAQKWRDPRPAKVE